MADKHFADTRPTAKQRQLEDMEQESRPSSIFTNGQTALSKGLGEYQQAWLLEHAISRWDSLHGALSTWRGELLHFEKLADDDYSDRASAPDPEKSSARRSIFERENHTLGLVSGMCDSVYSRAKSDLFSVRPWLAATPQGKNDTDLANRISKHCQWKFNQSNLEDTLVDALKLAVDLGTVFVKAGWCKQVDPHESAEFVAWSKSKKAAIVDAAGDFITDKAAPELSGMDGADVEWKEMLITGTTETYNNIESACLDFKDVAFDPLQPALDLRYTPFFHRFPARVLDLVAKYKLTEEQKAELLLMASMDDSGQARNHRGESESTSGDPTMLDEQANPELHLVEGFIRCDPTLSGRPIRIHLIFAPELRVLFRCDYLANESPDSILPVFPVRCFKTPRRIIGRGYWERFESENDAIDKHYCGVTFRNRHGADVIKGWHRSALANESEGEDLVNHPEKLFELKEDKKLTDLIEFAVVPDTNERSVSLMSTMAQFLQMRTGLTSAAQGEIKGLPASNTATGVNTLMTMGALLVKTQVAQMTKDVQPIVEFSVHLNYANQDRDETFVWGEGQDAELLEIKAGDVKGLRANVTLTMTQAHNMEQLENAKAAIEIVGLYIAVPEPEKPAVRRLYIQALENLGFNDADRIIRDAVVDPASLMALIPPDLQPAFQAFLVAQGLVAAPGAEGTPADAPVMAAPAV